MVAGNADIGFSVDFNPVDKTACWTLAEISGGRRLMEQLVAARGPALQLDRAFGGSCFSLRVYLSDCRARVSVGGAQRVPSSPEWYLDVSASGVHLCFLLDSEPQVSVLLRWRDISKQLADIYPDAALYMQE